jgi:hypothetical protein
MMMSIKRAAKQKRNGVCHFIIKSDHENDLLSPVLLCCIGPCSWGISDAIRLAYTKVIDASIQSPE